MSDPNAHPAPYVPPAVGVELRGVIGLITPAELAVAISVTEQTLSTWRTNGEGPDFVKLGKGVFYRLEDILAWVKKRVTSVVIGGKTEPQKVPS